MPRKYAGPLLPGSKSAYVKGQRRNRYTPLPWAVKPSLWELGQLAVHFPEVLVAMLVVLCGIMVTLRIVWLLFGSFVVVLLMLTWTVSIVWCECRVL
ncbi:hypothetical protein NFJ02_15g20980 [Pycnococcus provasolii]